MKQVKFLMVALTILMGTMVTSCMDGGEANTIMQGNIPMRVKPGMFGTTFVSGALEIVPSATTSIMVDDLPSNTKIAVVLYQYDTALQPITENTKKVTVELLGKPQSADAPFHICPNAEDESDVKSTHAVASLTVASGYSSVSPYLLSVPVMAGLVSSAEYYVIAPIGYKIKSVQKEELKAELGKHAFTAVLYMDEIEPGATTMVVYLRHVIREESATADEKNDRTVNYAEYKAFELTDAIDEFNMKSGVNPTKVIVKAMENMSSDELKGGNEKSYEIPLKIEE